MTRDQIDYEEFCRRAKARQESGSVHAGMPDLDSGPAAQHSSKKKRDCADVEVCVKGRQTTAKPILTRPTSLEMCRTGQTLILAIINIIL
jgi:hypothetical protein